MRRRTYLFSAVLVVAVGLGAYKVTVASRSQGSTVVASDDATETLLSWLEASPDQRTQLRQADPGFPAELKQLKADLAARRANLASLLEKAGSTNDQITAGLEQVIAADNALERRVAKYLLAVRDHLTVEQQRQLLNLCAEKVRHGRGYQWGRQPRSSDGEAQPGRGRHGRGGPGGGGRPDRPGAGQGPG